MKKKFFLVGIIATMSLGAFLVSCSKDDDKKDNFKGCTCTQVDYDGWRGTFPVSASEAKEYGLTDCNQVAAFVKRMDEDAMTVNCSPL